MPLSPIDVADEVTDELSEEFEGHALYLALRDEARERVALALLEGRP